MTLPTTAIAGGQLAITQLGFGTAAMGGLYQPASAEDSWAAMQAAWDAGIRHFDTAPFYGFGLAERRLGDFLRAQKSPKKSEGYVLSTKVGRLLRPVPESEIPDHGFRDPLPFTVEYDYSYDGIMRSLEFSFARLGLNKIDILYIHDIGELTHGPAANARHMAALYGSGFKALEQLRGDGTITAFGLGVNEIEVAQEIVERAQIDLLLMAGRYTLLDRTAARELLPRCQAAGTAVITGGVFNSGILATGTRAADAHFNYAAAPPEILRKVATLEAVAERHGVPLPAAALQFPLRHPGIAGVLFGAAAPGPVRQNAAYAQMPIPEAAWAEFDQALGVTR
ncbi:MAG: pyridoxal 4-dehydrogenase [Rhodospirillales bacterium 20-64-7]|nr:MAG: pyridoxal 4-dehydrogenase [Rhodospirillales bacterium 20-64-7]